MEIDAIDLTRSRSYRPLAVGRCPVAEPGRFAWSVPQEALIEPSRRDRLLGWIKRTGAEASGSNRPTGRAWPGRPWASRSLIRIGLIGSPSRSAGVSPRHWAWL